MRMQNVSQLNRSRFRTLVYRRLHSVHRPVDRGRCVPGRELGPYEFPRSPCQRAERPPTSVRAGPGYDHDCYIYCSDIRSCDWTGLRPIYWLRTASESGFGPSCATSCCVVVYGNFGEFPGGVVWFSHPSLRIWKLRGCLGGDLSTRSGLWAEFDRFQVVSRPTDRAVGPVGFIVRGSVRLPDSTGNGNKSYSTMRHVCSGKNTRWK